MKKSTIVSLTVCGVLLVGTLVTVLSQETARQPKSTASPTFEYASVRFMEEKTSIVWPDGTVENVMALTGKRKFENGNEKYPKGADYRMYWLTVAMNVMAQRGFELAHMHENDAVMKRLAGK